MNFLFDGYLTGDAQRRPFALSLFTEPHDFHWLGSFSQTLAYLTAI